MSEYTPFPVRLSMTAALKVALAAAKDLGQDLGGFPLWALLADNFPEESLAVCKVVAEQLKRDVPALAKVGA